jgi:tyrocidine synthetase-3
MIFAGLPFMCVPVTHNNPDQAKETIMPLELMQTSCDVPFADADEPPQRLRYYSHLCPPFPYEPTRDRVEVVGADGKGEGLRAVLPIKKGDVVFRFYGPHVHEQTLYTLQLHPGDYISDPLVMGKVLHSCDPNISCEMSSQTFTARRDIRAGEFLTMDYETTEDELFRAFRCGCGAANCRGFIRGRRFR